MPTKSISPGITRDRRGFRVFVKVRIGHRVYELRTKRFPNSATLSTMKAWREAQRVQARTLERPRSQAGTLARDVELYLDQVAAMKTIAWRRRDLEAWVERFGDLDRRRLTAAMIRAQLHAWRTSGPVIVYVPRTGERRAIARPLSASACNHRRSALLHLFTVLDGKAAPNPVREVPMFREPPPAPRSRDLARLVAAIARLRNPKQRARARVLLWTGIRGNSELAAMTPEHVDLERALCFVPSGKGGAELRAVPLSAHGVEAWREFIAAKAWGRYDKDALRKSIGRACEREGLSGVRTYDLRHSIATALLHAGADLADVQSILGHTTPRMTRRYAPFQPHKLRAIAAKLLPSEVAHAPQIPEREGTTGK